MNEPTRHFARRLAGLVAFALPALAAAQVVTIHPSVATPGTPRLFFLHTVVPPCVNQSHALDTSTLDLMNFATVRTTVTPLPCPLPPPGTPRVDLLGVLTPPARAGRFEVRWDIVPGGRWTFDNVAALPASRFDVNGMWADAATEGSGLALHHRRGSQESVFGTWFMFDRGGAPVWYSVQAATWQEDGSVLEALLYPVTRDGTCQVSGSSEACPARGVVAPFGPEPGSPPRPAGRVRLHFNTANEAVASAEDPSGAAMFSSRLKRIPF